MGLPTLKADYSAYLESKDEFRLQDEWWRSDANLALCKEIAARVPEDASVIDAGAGSGVLARCLLERTKRVIAIDNCQRAVDALRDVPGLTIMVSDLRDSIPMMVDVVIAKAVLKHFGPRWRTILRNLCDAASERLIFSMNVAGKSGDQNPDVPYYDWAEPLSEIILAMPVGWTETERFGDEKEPVFVYDRR